jgi:hypothetical protein
MNADWLRYDPEAGLLFVTNSEGKTGRYVKALTLQPVGGWDIEVAFVGYVIRFDESALRCLPERMVVKRLAETNPLFGTPLAGASNARFEYVRRD